METRAIEPSALPIALRKGDNKPEATLSIDVDIFPCLCNSYYDQRTVFECESVLRHIWCRMDFTSLYSFSPQMIYQRSFKLVIIRKREGLSVAPGCT